MTTAAHLLNSTSLMTILCRTAIYEEILAARGKIKKKDKPATAKNKKVVKRRKKAILTRKQLKEWNSMSRAAQLEYLEEHPDSIYQDAEVKEEDDENMDDENSDDESDDDEDTNDESDKSENESDDDENMDDAESGVEKANTENANTEKSAIEKTDAETPKSVETGIPPSAPTDEDKSNLDDLVKKIENDSTVLTAGSEHRSEAAAVVAEQGEKILEDALGAQQANNLAAEAFEKIEESDDEDEELDTRSFVEKHPVLTKFAAVAGVLIIGGIVGVGLATVSPSLGLLFGIQFMENLPAMMGALSNTIESSLIPITANDFDTPLNVMVQLIAKYIEEGNLPTDAINHLKNMYKQ